MSLSLGAPGAGEVMPDELKPCPFCGKSAQENEALLLDRNELLAHYQRSTAEGLTLKAELEESR